MQGGFLMPAMPLVGLPSTASTGLYVRWHAPIALALRGHELLVADGGSARLWRVDLMSQGLTAIAGAPVSQGTALAIGPDLSAWVLDRGARQVLRFARDGRLLQTLRIDTAVPSAVAMALADGGATLLLADGAGASWSEQRGGTPFARIVQPQREDGQRITSVDALAIGAQGLYVLDRLAGAVHLVSRDGVVRATFGRGELMQPVALAIDRLDRIHVLDAQDSSLRRLANATSPARHWSAAELGVQRINAFALDSGLLALADTGAGQVVLHLLGADEAG
jgi:hypothetical protein